ncbi:MAG: DnaJ domain-containing protein [Myxococcales bacterium]|nr:DnaJ domain-containing protein [Myxococcales bacterium]
MNAKPTTEGSFRKTPFPNVLLYARDKRLSGSLVVSIPGDAGHELEGDSTLVLEGGALVAIALPRETVRVAQVLRELGFISADALVQAEKAYQDSGADEMATLLRNRAVTPASLDRGLREVHRRRVLGLFGIADGTYAYFAGVDLLDGAGSLRAPEDVLPMVARGMFLHPPDAASIQGVLDRISGRLVRLKEQNDFDRFEFGEEVGIAATQLRAGPSSIPQLETLATSPDNARVMLYLLALTKQIEAVNSARGNGTTENSTVQAGANSMMPTPAAGMPAMPGGVQRPLKAPPPPPPPRPTSASPAPAAAPTEPAAPTAEATEAAPEPATPAAPAASALENIALSKEAIAHLKRLEHSTYFEMFDLSPKASVEEVRGAFTRMAATWHPDRAPQSLNGIYTEIFSLYNTAFQTLSDATARDEYEGSLHGGGGTPAAQKTVKNVLETVQDLHRAEIAVKRKNFAEAEPLLRKVLSLNADDITGNLLLAQVLLENNAQAHLDQVQPMLQRVIKGTERNDRAHFLMGMVLKHRGDRRAIGYFRQALEMNSQNLDAQRELRLAEIRSKQQEAAQAPTGVAGFLNKLFKK